MFEWKKILIRGGRQISLELSLDQGLQHICHLIWYLGLTWSATAQSSQSKLIVYLYWPKLRWQFLNSTSSQLQDLSLSWLGDSCRYSGLISSYSVITLIPDFLINNGPGRNAGKGLMHQAGPSSYSPQLRGLRQVLSGVEWVVSTET